VKRKAFTTEDTEKHRGFGILDVSLPLCCECLGRPLMSDDDRGADDKIFTND